jgi:hypothetical protein
MIDIITAILAIDPSSQLSIGSNDINDIRWHDGNPNNITNEEILVKQTELQAEYDALAWKRSREAEYPSIADLVIALYDSDDKAAVDAKRVAIKAKYPKPE